MLRTRELLAEPSLRKRSGAYLPKYLRIPNALRLDGQNPQGAERALCSACSTRVRFRSITPQFSSSYYTHSPARCVRTPMYAAATQSRKSGRTCSTPQYQIATQKPIGASMI